MNRRKGLVLFTAFVIAALCTLVVWRMVAVRLGSGARKGTAVVAAAANIKIGTVLSASDLKTVEIVGTLPKGALQDTKAVIGRGVVSDLYEGEPVLESRLAAVGSGGGLAATIPRGMRVCAVKVDEVVGVAGFVTPGMRVDVLVSGTPPGATNATEGPQVRTLLQNIEVKSAGTDIEKDAQGKPQQVQVVNLLVTPEQAESLSLASSQTRIQLVLRNPLDTQIAKTPGNGVGNLFSAGMPTAKPVAIHREARKAPPQVYTVEVFNGSKGSTAQFAASGVKQ
jgi:pilus assembly protein CpaB